MTTKLQVEVPGQGLHDITPLIRDYVDQTVEETGAREGVCHLFIQHTSASLLIQENYDPSARRDLEAWVDRLVPENDPLYTHTLEGPDDMPAHIKAALTATSLSVPIMEGRLALGTWQGIFLWEHRRHRGRRSVIAHVSG